MKNSMTGNLINNRKMNDKGVTQHNLLLGNISYIEIFVGYLEG